MASAVQPRERPRIGKNRGFVMGDLLEPIRHLVAGCELAGQIDVQAVVPGFRLAQALVETAELR